MPNLIMITGSNGSGKTTAAPALLQHAVHIDNFVNADIIAQGLSAFQPETTAIQAGRVMLDRIHNLAKEQANFAFETTLASRTFAPWIRNLKTQGYRFHLTFIWLSTVELAISRVQERIKKGGHAVPEATIRRRYLAGLKNFFNLYQPLTDSWQFYDNSDSNRINLIASEITGHSLVIKQASVWKMLREKYHGK